MAGASFKMDISGALAAFAGAITHLSDTKGLMEGIGEMLVSSAKERFEKGVGPDGTPWKPSKRVLKSGGQTLVDKGHLKKSLSYQAGDDYVAVGTPNEKYGAIHQFGGAGVGRPGTPERPYIGVSEDDMDEVREMVLDHVKGAF